MTNVIAPLQTEGVTRIFSVSPQYLPAGKYCSAVIAFQMFHCLPATHPTYLHRNLYMVLFLRFYLRTVENVCQVFLKFS